MNTFDGETYVETRDAARLCPQLKRVKKAMTNAGPLTLAQIAKRSGFSRASIASISARVRDLRKAKFGGHCVNREYLRRGTFTYELVA